MNYTSVVSLYFSPTLTTRTVVRAVADRIASLIPGSERRDIDITPCSSRENTEGALTFTGNDIVVFGAPVYIGRMPNLVSPYFRTISGNGAAGVPVAVYGHRHYDDGLRELAEIMDSCGFRCVAGAAFVGEHSMSRILGAGRPDSSDLALAVSFAEGIVKGLGQGMRLVPDMLPGGRNPYKFFKATDERGNPVDIRKCVPATSDACDGCGLCADLCPMGSIDHSDFRTITGICIKCGSCIKRCPRGAKYFADEQYHSHRRQLERMFAEPRCEPEIFWGESAKG